MWDLIAKLLALVLGSFGAGDKPDPVEQGEKLGKAEAQRDSAVQSLKDQDKVDTAGDVVRVDLERHPERVREPDDAQRAGFDPDAKQ